MSKPAINELKLATDKRGQAEGATSNTRDWANEGSANTEDVVAPARARTVTVFHLDLDEKVGAGTLVHTDVKLFELEILVHRRRIFVGGCEVFWLVISHSREIRRGERG